MKIYVVNLFQKLLITAITAAISLSVSLPVISEERCRQNIQCSEASDWGKTTRAVVRVNSGGHCSGTLLNNTAEDNTVFVATAGHCFDSENETGISIDFNYEISCNADRRNSFVRPQNYQTLTNGYLVAWDPSIDAALIRFESPIPDGVDAYFAGWDLTTESSNEPHALIHHVGGGAKSFALANGGRIFSQSNRFYNPLPQGNYYERKWHTQGYDIGYMGGGSSGAGLFYGDEFFIGILNGNVVGTEVPNRCENGPEQYIRHTQLGHIWEPNPRVNPPIIPLALSNFKAHLDPLNTGVTRFRGKELVSTPLPTPTISPTPDPCSPLGCDITGQNPKPSVWYYIVHKPTKAKIQSCATEVLTPVVSRPNSNLGSCVQWMAIANDGFFHLQNRLSEMFMKPDSSEDNSFISVVPNTWRGNWTQWSYEPRGDGFGHILNRATGKYIQFSGIANASIKQQPSSWRGDYSRWHFEVVE